MEQNLLEGLMPRKRRPIAYITRIRDDDDPHRVGKTSPNPYYIYNAWSSPQAGATHLGQYRAETLAPLNDDDPTGRGIDSGLSVLGALLEGQGFQIVTNLQGATIKRTLRRFTRAKQHNEQAQEAHHADSVHPT